MEPANITSLSISLETCTGTLTKGTRIVGVIPEETDLAETNIKMIFYVEL